MPSYIRVTPSDVMIGGSLKITYIPPEISPSTTPTISVIISITKDDPF